MWSLIAAPSSQTKVYFFFWVLQISKIWASQILSLIVFFSPFIYLMVKNVRLHSSNIFFFDGQECEQAKHYFFRFLFIWCLCAYTAAAYHLECLCKLGKLCHIWFVSCLLEMLESSNPPMLRWKALKLCVACDKFGRQLDFSIFSVFEWKLAKLTAVYTPYFVEFQCLAWKPSDHTLHISNLVECDILVTCIFFGSNVTWIFSNAMVVQIFICILAIKILSLCIENDSYVLHYSFIRVLFLMWLDLISTPVASKNGFSRQCLGKLILKCDVWDTFSLDVASRITSLEVGYGQFSWIYNLCTTPSWMRQLTSIKKANHWATSLYLLSGENLL